MGTRPVLTAVSLFSGIGAFDRAFTRAGFTVTAAVEIDHAARGVLHDNYPDVTLFHDVREVSADDILHTGFDPRTGCLIAGWPCTDLSLAGRSSRPGWSTFGPLLGDRSAPRQSSASVVLPGERPWTPVGGLPLPRTARLRLRRHMCR